MSASSLARGSTETPLYQQVVTALREQILKGSLPVGSNLPTEGELCASYGVSRHTVREALRQLRADGLVTSRRGSGTTVMQPGSTNTFVHEVGSLADLIQYAKSARYRIDESVMIEADAALAQRLDGEAGKSWLRISGFRYTEEDDVPLCYTVVYVTAEYAGIARLAGKRQTAVYELIEDLYGVRFSEVEQLLHARPVPDEIHQALQMDQGATVIEVIRVYRLTSGQIAEVAVNLYPAERFSMSMKLRSRGA